MRIRFLLSFLSILCLPSWGDAAAPYLVKDIFPGNTGESPQPPTDLFAFGNKLFFVAHASGMGVELWVSDGTAAGTTVVKDINPGPDDSTPKIIGSVNGLLIFEADDGSGKRSVWRSNGMASGTVKIKDIHLGTFDRKSQAATIGSTLFFAAADTSTTAAGTTTGYELWKSDGTTAGTMLVKDIYPGTSWSVPQSSDPEYLTNVSGILFFSADDGTHGRELWRSDGRTVGTVLVKDINSSYLYSPGSSDPQFLAEFIGYMFFTAYSDYNHGLWKSNGIEAGTVFIYGSNAKNLLNINGMLYFTDYNSLYKSDGTAVGTVRIKDINSEPQNLTNFNGTLFFTADDGTSGSEVWKSDGTAAGTGMLKDIYPGYSGSNPQNLMVVNNTLFFTTDDGTHGNELWQSDGTAAGTVMVKDIDPGTRFYSSDPQELTKVGDTLFFTAYEETHGRELWALNTNTKVPVVGTISDGKIPDDQTYTGPTPVLTQGTSPITWSFVRKPSGMTINAQTGIVTWSNPVASGTPYTVTIRASNAQGHADASWHLTVYHPGPPSTLQGGLVVTYTVRTPSTSPDGKPVQYTYAWTSDKGEKVTHGPTTATTDNLVETNLIHNGDTWTVRVTPRAGSYTGATVTATVKFVNVQNGVAVWSFYK